MTGDVTIETLLHTGEFAAVSPLQECLLARHLLPQVVGAHSDMAGVHGAEVCVSHSVDRVGQVSGSHHGLGDSGHRGNDHMGGSNHGGGSNNSRSSSNNGGSSSHNTMVAKSGISESGISESSIRQPGDNNSSISIGFSFGFPLPPAGNSSSEVVGAETHQAGVDGTGGGGSNSMHGVGDSVSDSSVSEVASIGQTVSSGDNNTGISISFPLLPSAGHSSSVDIGAETIMAGVDTVNNSMHRVVSISDSSIGQTVSSSDNNTGVSISLPLAVVVGMMVGNIGTGDGDIGSVHTGSALVPENMSNMSVAIVAVGIGFGSSHGHHSGESNKELHDDVRMIQL